MLRMIGMPVMFPMHPRTAKRISEFNCKQAVENIPGMAIVAPESYVDFLSLLAGAALILSDSGSVQAEASFFNVSCLICRENAERPIYLEHGTSTLIGRDKEHLRLFLEEIRFGEYRESDPVVRELGRGVAKKTVQIIARFLGDAGSS
jgi:UDP-N-acetylglucosamine 2-epimerase (non-hydrolysing)